VPLVLVVGVIAEFRLIEPDIKYWMYQDEIHEIVKDSPVVSFVPQPVKDSSVADLKDGLRITQFGYSVQVPRMRIVFSKEYKTISMRKFEDGLSMILFDPADHMDMLRSTSGNEAAMREGLRPLLGDQAVRSHYDYAVAEMNVLPADVSFFHSRKSVARAGILLSMKSLDVPKGSTVIYSVVSSNLKGFQFGDPQKLPMRVNLLLFDEKDRPIAITIAGPRDETEPVLTQAQINAIIASIHSPN
jgi:hypothetical protein